MGQLWAALKSLGAIASLLSELLKWLKELREERRLHEADTKHTANEQAIEDAFDPGPVAPVATDRVPDSTASSESRPEAPKSSPI